VQLWFRFEHVVAVRISVQLACFAELKQNSVLLSLAFCAGMH